MKNILRLVKKNQKDRGLVEYSLIISLVILVVIVALGLSRTSASNLYLRIKDEVTNIIS